MTATIDLEEQYQNARNDADLLGRRLYRESVAALAESIAEDYDEDTPLPDAVHETCDSSEWVIYTAKAHDVLRFSDNDDACEGSVGDDASVEVRAFFALEADVYDYLRDNYEYPADTVGELLGDSGVDA